MRTETSDQEFRGTHGGPETFRLLFDRHYAVVHRYLRRRLGEHVADELASETFAIAYGRRQHLVFVDGSARPWLFGIATNLLRSHHRREARCLRAYARTGRDPLALAGPESDLDRLAADGCLPALLEALASLRSAERDVLFLYAWADLSYVEIAAALGLPVGTVRSRLHRARQCMRAALGPAFRDLIDVPPISNGVER
jgi:RNA polymerase sigma factor (sigma-70 family)